MWGLVGCNEVHNLVIKEITDNSWRDSPYVIMNCTGFIATDYDSRYRGALKRYPCTVKAEGDLMNYVLNELAVNDKIVVIGYSSTGLRDGKWKQRETRAVQICKPEWLHYKRS